MYGQVNWEGRGHHNYQVPPLQDIQLPPMEEAGISDVDSIRSKNVYDYPVFFDIGQNQYITGKERKKLKEGKAKSKWDFFYRYSPNAMDQIKYKRLSYLDSELQKREQVRKGKIRDQQEKIRKFKNLKAKIRRSRIIMIIVASIITIASLGISFYNKETCCFYTTGLFFIILIIVIIIAVMGTPKIDKKIAACYNRIQMYEHIGQLDMRRVAHEKYRVSDLVSQLEVSQVPPSERTMDMWHYGAGDGNGELQHLEIKAIEELGLEVDRRYNKIAQAVSYEADGDSKAFPGFYSLFIDGPGMLQHKKESGYELYPVENMKSLYIGKKVHFRITYNQFIVPTRHKLCSYRFFYDRIEKKQKGVRTEEYFYEDVVMITTSMETRKFILTEKAEEFYTFIMTLKSADKIKVSLSDEGLIEMIEMKLEDSIEPLYRDRVSSLKHDRSLYELDRRVQNEARLIVKNIRTQMAEIKRGTGNQGQRGTRVSGRGRKTQQRPELDREFKLGLKSRNGNTMPPPIEYDYE